MKRPESRIVTLQKSLFIFNFSDQIALINDYVVLYKTLNDVTICLVGRGEESNELLLYTAVETIFEALSEIIK